jgi:hypothetical protein
MFSKDRLWSRLTVLLLIGFFIAACDGSDGAAGAPGAAGADGADGADGATGAAGPPAGYDPIAEAKVESCATCHDGVGEGKHQSIYDQFTDPSTLALEITALRSTDVGGGDFSVEVDFSITQNGAPYIDPVGTSPSVESTSFYVVKYDSGTGEFLNAGGYFPSLSPSNAASIRLLPPTPSAISGRTNPLLMSNLA